MESREGNQRPISRQSYAGYRPPANGGRPAMPARRPITPVRPVDSQNQATVDAQESVHEAEQVQQTSYSAPPVTNQNVTVLNKPVWSVDAQSDSQPVRVQEQVPQEAISQDAPMQQNVPEIAPSPEQPRFEQSANPAPQPLTFEAPPKPKKSLPKIKVPKFRLRDLSKMQLMIIGAVLGLIAFGGTAYGVVAWQSNRADPNTILKAALTNHLTLKQVEVNSASGVDARVSAYDFADLQNPVVTSRFVVQQYGASFDISTYGDNQNTFLRYNKLPDSVTSNIRTGTENKWIKIRDQDKVPLDASHRLSSFADPRAQIFGPIIFGNFDEKTRTELSNFLIKNQVYKLELDDKAPAKTKVDDKKVVILPVALDVGQLKVGIQSAALSMGYSPDDVAEAVRALDFYKGAKADIYVTSRGGKIVKMVITAQNGSQTEIAYKNFDKNTTEAQPNSSVAWKEVAQTVWQLESQVAAKLQSSALDTYRKASLDSLASNLASYRAQKGYYPTLANMNNLSWLSTLVLGAPEMQRDPLGVNLTLSSIPQASTYAYIPAPSSGAGACDNVNVPCATFKLISVLSDGKQHIVTNP